MAKKTEATVTPGAAATATATTTTDAATAASTTTGTAAASAADAGNQGATKPGGEAAAASGTEADVDSLLTGDAEDQGAETDFELKLPDGVQLDALAQKDFKALAKRRGLNAEGAQEFVDFSAKLTAEAQKQQREQYAKTVKGWQDAARTDKEFGGKDFESNMAVANKALTRLGGKPLVEVLQKSGLSNHPDVIRTFYRAGKLMSEPRDGGIVVEGAPTREGEEPKDPWTALYEGKMGPPAGPVNL